MEQWTNAALVDRFLGAASAAAKIPLARDERSRNKKRASGRRVHADQERFCLCRASQRPAARPYQ